MRLRLEPNPDFDALSVGPANHHQRGHACLQSFREAAAEGAIESGTGPGSARILRAVGGHELGALEACAREGKLLRSRPVFSCTPLLRLFGNHVEVSHSAMYNRPCLKPLAVDPHYSTGAANIVSGMHC